MFKKLTILRPTYPTSIFYVEIINMHSLEGRHGRELWSFWHGLDWPKRLGMIPSNHNAELNKILDDTTSRLYFMERQTGYAKPLFWRHPCNNLNSVCKWDILTSDKGIKGVKATCAILRWKWMRITLEACPKRVAPEPFPKPASAWHIVISPNHSTLRLLRDSSEWICTSDTLGLRPCMLCSRGRWWSWNVVLRRTAAPDQGIERIRTCDVLRKLLGWNTWCSW